MAVEIILIISMTIGTVVLFSSEVKMAASTLRYKCNICINGFKTMDAKQDCSVNTLGINESISRLLNITLDMGNKKAVVVFWILSIGTPIIFFALFYNKVSFGISFISSIFIAMIPLILILGKLQAMRVKSSREGKLMMTELMDNYKIYYFNMQQAVEITAATIEEAPSCKRLLFNLSKGLNRVSGGEEIKKLLDDFKFSIGTSWSVVLADNMYFALLSGIKVTAAMEDLIRTVAKAEEVEENAMRENNEAGLILKYLVPVCYLMTIVGGIECFNLTLLEFFKYQFCTTAGLGWFMTALLVYSIGLAARWFMTCRKLDL